MAAIGGEKRIKAEKLRRVLPYPDLKTAGT